MPAAEMLSRVCSTPAPLHLPLWRILHDAISFSLSAGVGGRGNSVPSDYEMQQQCAVWTFQHQCVWCPRQKQLTHIADLPDLA